MPAGRSARPIHTKSYFYSQPVTKPTYTRTVTYKGRGTSGTHKRYKLFKRMRSPIPYSIMRKLVFSFSDNLNPGTGVTGTERTFTLNGIYDPLLGGGTPPQPVGFDQYMQLYDHYTVLATKVVVNAFNEGSTPITANLLIKDTPGGFINTQNVRENMPNSQTKYLTATGGSSDRIRLQRYVDIGKFFHTNVISRTDLQGDATRNPTDQVYVQVLVANVDNADNPDPMLYTIRFEYLVMFREPKILPLS